MAVRGRGLEELLTVERESESVDCVVLVKEELVELLIGVLGGDVEGFSFLEGI